MCIYMHIAANWHKLKPQELSKSTYNPQNKKLILTLCFFISYQLHQRPLFPYTPTVPLLHGFFTFSVLFFTVFQFFFKFIHVQQCNSTEEKVKIGRKRCHSTVVIHVTLTHNKNSHALSYMWFYYVISIPADAIFQKHFTVPGHQKHYLMVLVHSNPLQPLEQQAFHCTRMPEASVSGLGAGNPL